MKLIHIRALDEISTSKNKKGDLFSFEVSENLFINKVLVIPKGTAGTGQITYLKRAGRFGRPARIKIEVQSIESIAGEMIPVNLIDAPQATGKKISVATTLSVCGFSLLGPAGLIGGAFVKGPNISIGKDTELFLEVTEDTSVIGAGYVN